MLCLPQRPCKFDLQSAKTVLTLKCVISNTSLKSFGKSWQKFANVGMRWHKLPKVAKSCQELLRLGHSWSGWVILARLYSVDQTHASSSWVGLCQTHSGWVGKYWLVSGHPFLCIFLFVCVVFERSFDELCWTVLIIFRLCLNNEQLIKKETKPKLYNCSWISASGL